jgi:hypothetical protein
MKRTALLLFGACGVAGAQSLPNYSCTIERIQTAGHPTKQVQAMHSREYLGKTFTVERRTGIMSGVLKNSFVTRPEVIDFGSIDNSYKAVTTLRLNQGSGSGTNIHALVVNEYEKTSSKSFVFMDNDEIFFGSCSHLRQ